MENTIKGWQYISAIFQRMLDSFERDCLIEPLFIFRGITRRYFSSSKTTLTDYQCVSTGCCTHVAKTEITIDNQHVTKSLQRYRFIPKQPKENT